MRQRASPVNEPARPYAKKAGATIENRVSTHFSHSLPACLDFARPCLGLRVLGLHLQVSPL